VKAAATTTRTIDEYIAGFPPRVRAILRKMRSTIRKAAPGAKEKISYEIPTFTLNGKYLVYFAAYREHVSLYPAPRGAPAFRKELSRYAGGKGTVRFPIDKPIPYGVIARIVRFRVKEAGRAARKPPARGAAGTRAATADGRVRRRRHHP
jgi:uncharacterized protein YdhG (YjbR/CyaY superfamily)